MDPEETRARVKKLRDTAYRDIHNSQREWPHHARHTRKCAQEMLAEAARLEEAISIGLDPASR